VSPMSLLFRRLGRQRLICSAGYSLVELMMTVLILGILGTVSTIGFYKQYQDREAEGIAMDILNWIVMIRTAAGRARTCDVQFTTGAIAPGSRIAQSSMLCRVFQAADVYLNSKTTYPSFSLSTSKPNFSFSSRGVLHQRIPSPTRRVDPVVLVVTVASSGRSRCIILDGILGEPSLGFLQNNQCKELP